MQSQVQIGNWNQETGVLVAPKILEDNPPPVSRDPNVENELTHESQMGSLLDSFVDFHSRELGWFYEAWIIPRMQRE